MAANKLIFKDAEKARDAILESQKKEIAQLYEKWADEIGEKAQKFSYQSTASSIIQEQQMKELQSMLMESSYQISNEVYSKIRQNIYYTAAEVTKSNVEWMKSLGFAEDALSAAFNSVPDATVRNLVTGQIYDSGWSLSKRIWGDNEDTLKSIYEVVAGGVAQNKSMYEIAKSLEDYVRPTAMKPWNLVAADGKKIYPKQVDYNAQRLGRTLVQHGYQQSFVATTQNNPFITDYIWDANGSRVCDLCLERDGMHYKKTELPLDHPNGMCTMVPNVVNNLVDQLADWHNAPDGTYPEIDAFAKNFGYGADKSLSGFAEKYGTSTKSWSGWLKSLPSDQKAEALQLKDAAGQTWKEWYGNNVFVGTADQLETKKRVAETISAPFDKDEWLDILSKNKTKYMEKWTDDWVKLLTDQQQASVNLYTGTAYSDINPYLRGINNNTWYKNEIEHLKVAMDKANIPEEIIVRRGTDFNAVKGLFKEASGEEIQNNLSKYIGATINDKGFISTSPSPNGGFSGSIELVIKIPKDANAMYVAPISRHRSELEVLINANSNFIVEYIQADSNKYIEKIFLTMIK